jgi:hypothetical protein
MDFLRDLQPPQALPVERLSAAQPLLVEVPTYHPLYCNGVAKFNPLAKWEVEWSNCFDYEIC